jgi:hypothetical protein
MKKLRAKAKPKGNIVMVESFKTPNQYLVKVYIDVAFDYIKSGYDDHDYIKVTVANKNFDFKPNSRAPREKIVKKYSEETNLQYEKKKSYV